MRKNTAHEHSALRAVRRTHYRPQLKIGVLFAIVLVSASSAIAQGAGIAVPTPRPAIGDAVHNEDGRVEESAPAEPENAEPGGKPAGVDLPPVHRAACPALFDGRAAGELAEPVIEGDCRAEDALTLTALSGVMLSGEPMVACTLAGEIAGVVATADAIARDVLKSPLKRLITGPGYECRRRNRAETGKLSEHAFANALDIAGFELADGRTISVEKDWPRLTPDEMAKPVEERRASLAARAVSNEAKFLAAVHAAACARFTTVLGPDANAAHAGHFHFDLGCHGRACDYRICE